MMTRDWAEVHIRPALVGILSSGPSQEFRFTLVIPAPNWNQIPSINMMGAARDGVSRTSYAVQRNTLALLLLCTYIIVLLFLNI